MGKCINYILERWRIVNKIKLMGNEIYEYDRGYELIKFSLHISIIKFKIHSCHTLIKTWLLEITLESLK